MRISLIIAVIAIVGLIGARSFSDPVPHERLRSLKTGMTKPEVREVLGDPVDDHESQWSYSRFLVFGFVNIHFDTEGRYLGDYNYERF